MKLPEVGDTLIHSQFGGIAAVVTNVAKTSLAYVIELECPEFPDDRVMLSLSAECDEASARRCRGGQPSSVTDVDGVVWWAIGNGVRSRAWFREPFEVKLVDVVTDLEKRRQELWRLDAEGHEEE